MHHGPELPSLGLKDDAPSPAEDALQRQVRAWSMLPPAFAVGLPWAWLSMAFTHGGPRIPPVLACLLTSAALALTWYGRRRSRPILTWVGIGCYLLAVALCVLLAKVL
ncbi:hypothetical protein [Streptomyces sp. NPDC053427]|uniref:hypothetical protein n=1 Tax=Streptomyces sp. NPDC053427 TaxID=3365701 RepID=UPI0037D5F1E2